MSFDVVSLFSCVPVELAVDVDYPVMNTSLTIPPSVYRKLLGSLVSATYLSFRGEYYQQIFSTAMESPVSVTVANLVMEDVEDKALATDVPLRRYVDDTYLYSGELLPGDS